MNTYERYIWLIDTLRRCGRLTYEEIASRWEKSSLNDSRVTLEKRTFLNHIKAIENSMGVCICCDRKDSYRYFIDEDDTYANVNEWLMESISVSNTLCESRDMSDYIALESVPSGHQHLSCIIQAIRNCTSLSIMHLSYWRNESTMREVRPYALKLSDRRWYLVCYVEEYEKICAYGLDRIIDIDITDRKFERPADFDVKSFYEGCCGVIKSGSIERIRIRVTQNQAKFVDSLPLHESQSLIERNDEQKYAIFEYHVRPTLDFTRKILAYGAAIEVLEPENYRKEIANTAKAMLGLYELG